MTLGQLSEDNVVIKRRAISDEQKEERRQAILDAASQLFQETSYEAVNIAEVAEKAGIAKGTVYLYFKTKEELFLALQAQEFEAWFDEVDTYLEEIQAAQETCTIEELVALSSRSLENRPILVRLITIVHAILERNIDFSTALSFKQMLRSRILQTGFLLEACVPFLQPGQGARLMLLTYVLVIGFQQLADPAPVVKQTFAEPGMEIFKINFLDEFSEALKVFLYGLEYQSKQKE
jgi:AcrR family transcriptional regulator